MTWLCDGMTRIVRDYPKCSSVGLVCLNYTVLETCVFALCDAIMLCTGCVLFNLPSIIIMILGLFCELVYMCMFQWG